VRGPPELADLASAN
jgi:hypothetical protein